MRQAGRRAVGPLTHGHTGYRVWVDFSWLRVGAGDTLYFSTIMAGQVAVLAFVGVLVSVTRAAVPAFRFNYNEGGNPEGGVSQFYSGRDSAFVYNWGYQFPGRSHTESKSHDGNVRGNFQFVDANGEVKHTSYSAGPGFGFIIDDPQPVHVYGPAGAAADTVVVPTPIAEPFTQEFFSKLASQGIGLDPGSLQAITRASPQLLAAVRSGNLEPIRGSHNEIVFKVSNALVDEARGSVSALASILDADVAAARHDQQIVRQPASFYAANTGVAANRAILEIEQLVDGPGYVVRVPYY